MGSQIIGLDIGTHAVRAVELHIGRGRPSVRRMGQVALPPGAVVAGEVVDAPEVAAALRRLWEEVGFRSRSVVVGVANARVVARMTELPDLPDQELRSSLPFHVQDLIPIPVAEAELDFQVIDRVAAVEGESVGRVQVLLVAAHRDMLRSLLAALDGANLEIERIDLIPFALIRALHDPMEWLGADELLGGQEVIIGTGAGVTNIVVHENGVPRFVRTLPTGGAVVTDALAADLGLEFDQAEALKRGAGLDTADGTTAEVVQVTAQSLAPLANEVAGSLDFHLAQDDRAVRRVVVSGGPARLPALRTMLQDQLGVPVVEAAPYRGLDLSKISLDPAVVAASSDFFTVAIGLALSAEALPTGIRRLSLVPKEVGAARAARRELLLAGAGVGVFAALLLGLSVVRSSALDGERLAATRAEDNVATLGTEVAALADFADLETSVSTRTSTVQAALTGDVAWIELLNSVSAVLPEDVWLKSFNGTRGEAGALGTVQFGATGFDQTSAARFLLRVEEVPGLGSPWLSSSAKGIVGNREAVQFAADAPLTLESASSRLSDYVGSEP